MCGCGGGGAGVFSKNVYGFSIFLLVGCVVVAYSGSVVDGSFTSEIPVWLLGRLFSFRCGGAGLAVVFVGVLAFESHCKQLADQILEEESPPVGNAVEVE